MGKRGTKTSIFFAQINCIFDRREEEIINYSISGWCDVLMLCVLFECCAYCLNDVRTAWMLYVLFECCVYCLIDVRTVWMLCVLFECCTYCLNAVRTVWMLCVLFECCAYCLNAVRTVYRMLISLVNRTNFACTELILHPLSIMQPVSARHTCHHHGVFVLVIITLSTEHSKHCDNNCWYLCDKFLELLDTWKAWL